jgi:hypothetical protein
MSDQSCGVLRRSRACLFHRCDLKVSVRLRKGSRTSSERAEGERSETCGTNLLARIRLQNHPAGAASLAGSIGAIAEPRTTAALSPSVQAAVAVTTSNDHWAACQGHLNTSGSLR